MTRVCIPKFAIQFDSKACHTSVDWHCYRIVSGPVDDRQEVPEVVGLWHWPNEVDLEGLEVGQLSLEVAGLDMFLFIDFHLLAHCA